MYSRRCMAVGEWILRVVGVRARIGALRGEKAHREANVDIQVLVCTLWVPWIKEPSSHMAPRSGPYSPFRVHLPVTLFPSLTPLSLSP